MNDADDVYLSVNRKHNTVSNTHEETNIFKQIPVKNKHLNDALDFDLTTAVSCFQQLQ